MPGKAGEGMIARVLLSSPRATGPRALQRDQSRRRAGS